MPPPSSSTNSDLPGPALQPTNPLSTPPSSHSASYVLPPTGPVFLSTASLLDEKGSVSSESQRKNAEKYGQKLESEEGNGEGALFSQAVTISSLEEELDALLDI